MDMELRDWIVVQKGTIVSSTSTVLGVTGATAIGLVVPANGGADTVDTYTVNDQNAAVRDPNGNLVTAGQNYTRVANVPIGLAQSDMFQDIHGRFLNYENQPEALTLLCERTIEIPYFTYAQTGAVSPADAIARMKSKIGTLAYGNVANGSADLVNSSWVMSDPNGRFVKWDGVDVKQVVGQVLLLDSYFPKDLLQYVQTYPLSEMPGSETGGFPAALSMVGAVQAVRVRLKF
jgi:hypothetical protein